jgi:hypothetical protein
MAEFGTQATQLSAPQGAGSAPLAPVQEQAVNTSMLPMIAGAAPAIAQGISNLFQAKAREQEQTVVQQYSSEIGAINAAMENGSMTPAEGAARSRSITGKYLTGFSQYGEAINKARANFSSGTQIGIAEEAVKTDAEIRKSAKIAAQADGVEFYAGMSKEAEDSLLRAHASSVRMQKEMDRQFKVNAESRAQGSWDKDMRDAQLKEQSLILINDLAGSNLEASRSIALDLKAQVASGKKTFDQARMDLAMHYTRINAAITAAGGKNPELGATYSRLFGDLQKASEALLDPKADAANLQGQIDTIVKTQALGSLQRDPVLQNSVAAAELFKGSPMALQATLGSSAEVTNAVTKMLKGTEDTEDKTKPNPNVPPVVGNKDLEKGVYKTLEGCLRDLPKNEGNEKYKTEVSNIVNECLIQVGNKTSVGDAKSLQESAKFFASAEFGNYASKASLDPQVVLNASRAFKLNYEQVIVKGVQQKIQDAFNTSAALPAAGVMKRSMGGESVTVEALKPENLNVRFSGSGIVFDLKNVPKDPVALRNAKSTLDSLNKSQQAINQLIRYGTHLEGSTDYAKHWEANKHVYFPNLFSAYSNLEIGQVIDGMRYKGGDATQESSWEAIK